MGFMDKVRVAIFGDFEDDDQYEEIYEDEVVTDSRNVGLRDARELHPVSRPSYDTDRSEYAPLKPIRREVEPSGGKIVNFHTNVQMEFFVTSPQSFEEAQDICDNIRRNCPVVVNLEKVEQPTAQRLMDFISGACYSLDGSIQRVSNNIFLIAPNNIAISSDLKEELRTSAFVNPLTGAVK